MKTYMPRNLASAFFTRHTPSGNVGLRCIYKNGLVENCSLNAYNKWSYSCISRDTFDEAVEAMHEYDSKNGWPLAKLVGLILNEE